MAAGRGRKARSGRQAPPETPEAMRERVLRAFGRWLTEHDPRTHNPDDVLDVVHTACEFKASMLDEPNPADWSPAVLSEVVGDVFPAKTAGVDAQYARTIVPAMLIYLDFLVSTDRWKPHNDVQRSRQALLALADELPARFGDPSRMTMAGRLIDLALQEGVDPTDPAAFSGFMERFNEMPYEWRKRLTDAPGLPERLPAGTASAAVGFELFPAAAKRAIALGLSGLRFPAGDLVRVAVPAAAEEAAALRDMEFIRRMRDMVEWVGTGRSVTQTGAMRRTDTVDWMRRFGIQVTDDTRPATMWDIRDVGQPWGIAIETGMLELTSTKVRHGPAAAVFDTEDPAAQVNLGRRIVNVLLHQALSRSPFVDQLQPAIVTVMLALLAALCRPAGQDIDYLRAIAANRFTTTTAGDMVDSIAANVCSSILLEIRALDHLGLITGFDGTPRIPAGLRPAVVTVIHGPGAPLSVKHAAHAVPVDVADY